MGKTFTFANYPLSVANGVVAAAITGEMSPQKRVVTIADGAGARGVKIIRTQLKGKQIDIEGIIYASSESAFISAIRNITQTLMAEGVGSVPVGDLQVQNSDGTFVYENCLLLNTDSIFSKQEPQHITWIPFKLSFLSPKGFAKKTAAVTTTISAITSMPYTSYIDITGTADPEPVLTFTFNTASTISSLTFTNQTTGEAITVSGLTLANGDKLIIDIENKQVYQNTALKTFTGIFPSFKAGRNNYQISIAGGSNLDQDQHVYNSERTTYGANWLSQKFRVSGNISISQLALYLKQTKADVLALYEDFSGGSISGSKFTTSGSVTVSSGRMKLNAVGQSSHADTDNKLPGGGTPDGDGFKDAQFYFQWVGGGPEGTDRRWGISNGTDYIRFKSEHAGGLTRFETGGAFSGGGSAASASDGTIKILEEGGAVNVYFNDVFQFTAKASGGMPSGMYFFADAPQISASENYLLIDDMYFNQAASVNGDVTVRIETNTSGHPSGSAVTNGSLTIPIASISDTTFQEIIAAFSSLPALSVATDYWLVVKQSGGDVNNYVQVKIQNTDVYANGSVSTTGDSGANWSNQASEDMYFKLWSTMPTSFNVDYKNVYYPSYLTVV